MSIGKSKGPATIGMVPRAHKRMQSGLGEIPQFDPTFRSLDPGDGNELIAYEETDLGIARLRKSLEREIQVARSSLKMLMKNKLKEWKRAQLEEKRATIRRLKAEISTKRVKYTYAEISIDPEMIGKDFLTEVCIVNLWKNVDRGGFLRHYALLRPADFQMLFHCGKYKVNKTFHRCQLGNGGQITRQHDTIPEDATGVIWEYLGPLSVSERTVVGWYRHHERFRRLTAREVRKISKDLENSRFSLVMRDAGWVEWLDAHPRPDRFNDREIFSAWTNIQKLEKELSQAIRFQRCSHTKVVCASDQKELDTLVTLPLSIGNDYAGGKIPAYNSIRRWDEHSFDFRSAESIIFPAFGHGDWERRYVNRLVRTNGVWTLQESTLGQLMKEPETWIDLTSMIGRPGEERRTSTESKVVTLQTFDNDYPDPKIIQDPSRSHILTACLRQANKIEGLVFGRESADRLARSIVECKDLPQTAGQVRDFVRWLACGLPLTVDNMPQLKGSAMTRVMAAKTARAAAAAWLFWKFGVEPTAHDVNNLCSQTGNYLKPIRAGLTSMYRSLDQIAYDMTFKMKHKWCEEGVTGVYPQEVTRTVWIHLPCLSLYGPTSISGDPPGFRRDAGLIRLPEQVQICTDSYAEKTDLCANGTVILSNLVTNRISQSDYERNVSWLEWQIQRILFPVCTSIAWKTLETNVFARFAAEDIAAAYGWKDDWLSDMFGLHRALTTSWEVLPLSFIADWFLSTREVMEAINLQAFLKTEGLHLQPLDGVWLGHRFQYWNGVQGTHAYVAEAHLGTFDGLEAHGIPGLPEAWRGLTMKNWAYGAMNWGSRDHPIGEAEMEALDNWFVSHPYYQDDQNLAWNWAAEGGNSEFLTHLPILSLKLEITTADSPSVVIGQGTCYQRYKIDEALRPLAFVPVADMKVNAGKLVSLAALMANLVTVPKGIGKTRISPVAKYTTFSGNSRNPFRRFSFR